MIAYVKGELTFCAPGSVIIETGGIGYKISIPASVFGKLPNLNAFLFLHISHVIREQSQTLYGFLTIQERDLFEALMGVTGIGPKLALSLIGHLSLNSLCHAIANQDLSAISKVPGIGRKTAERLCIELRDKLSNLHFPEDCTSLATALPKDAQSSKVKDALSALINLGYNQNTAQKAIKKTLDESTTELDLASLITFSLQNSKG